MPQTLEYDWEWETRHGDDPYDAGNGVKLFPDGAKIDHYGCRNEPPPGTAGARARMEYHRLKKEQAEQAFVALKSALLSNDRYRNTFHWRVQDFGPGPADGLAGLNKLKEIAAVHRAAEAALKQEIGEDPAVADYESQRTLLAVIEERNRLAAVERANAIAALSLVDALPPEPPAPAPAPDAPPDVPPTETPAAPAKETATHE
jgi:hypothetical protein